ncbi:aminodeoxychorismate lyase [Thioalkalivibrio sp. ALJ24]|uniref:aminodeoxychorismate lyase n=1 Tax=Thioalkalivibrio sp. ALJ24 TaxID=545276 RepID=UPI0003785EF7|nr:aminodeoxychorismate lyase [Thioalkalivibrio sp. ALJ24]
MIRVNGEPREQVTADDRGLLLGDGLFETVLVREGHACLWPWHRARLEHGLERLGFPTQDMEDLRAEVETAGGSGERLVRLTLTRGSGPRGYAPPEHPAVTRIVSTGPALSRPAPDEVVPLRVGFADIPVSVNPALAGIKHLGRLDHVLARMHWRAGEDEAILRDANGRITCATQGNLWLREGMQLLTPPVESAGVAGTRRAWILERAMEFGVRVVVEWPSLERLQAAEGLYVSNARLGLMPAVPGENGIMADEPAPLQALRRALHEAD